MFRAIPSDGRPIVPDDGQLFRNGIREGLPTRCPVTRRFRGCECFGDLSPTIRQNGERRAPGRVPNDAA
jgi:hypothetical protein